MVDPSDPVISLPVVYPPGREQTMRVPHWSEHSRTTYRLLRWGGKANNHCVNPASGSCWLCLATKKLRPLAKGEYLGEKFQEVARSMRTIPFFL